MDYLTGSGMYKFIEEAIEAIERGTIRRMEGHFGDKKVTVYKVGDNLTRIDIKK